MAQFTNQAQLSYRDNITNSNVAVGELTEVLRASKIAVTDDYARNDDVTYVLSIVNDGTSSITGLTVTDSLGAYPFNTQTLYPLQFTTDSLRYYVNGVLQPAPAVTAGPPLVFTGITVPAGGNAMLIYEAQANRFAPLAAGAGITNTATVTGAGLTAPLSVSETVQTKVRPELTITKTVDPVPVTENGRLTYTFILQNTGNAPAEATDAVVVSDVFDPILRDLTVSLNAAALAPTTGYTYDAATGAFSTVAGQITVPAATFSQNAETGAFSVTPGVATLVVTGTV